MDIFIHSATVMAKVAAPFLIGLALTGIVANLLQVQFKFTPQVIKPRFSKLNPLQGFKRLLGVQSLVELAKNLFKLVVVGGPAVWTLLSHKRDLMILTSVDPMTAGQVTMRLISKIGFQVAAIYIALAIADYIWQRHSYEKRIKMTKQEVKQEQRQQDVAPEMKMAQRRRQRDSARRRMLSDVPQADVIITNPTHFSIALKYDPEEGAPRVVAKGADLLAKRIREIAAEAGVPRVENKPLARALYAETEIGQFIPPEMFAAVAEVLAFVYQTQRSGRGWNAERRLEHA